MPSVYFALRSLEVSSLSLSKSFQSPERHSYAKAKLLEGLENNLRTLAATALFPPFSLAGLWFDCYSSLNAIFLLARQNPPQDGEIFSQKKKWKGLYVSSSAEFLKCAKFLSSRASSSPEFKSNSKTLKKAFILAMISGNIAIFLGCKNCSPGMLIKRAEKICPALNSEAQGGVLSVESLASLGR